MTNDNATSFGVFFRPSASAAYLLDAAFDNLNDADLHSKTLRKELLETLTWPGVDIYVAPYQKDGTWSFNNTSLKLV